MLKLEDKKTLSEAVASVEEKTSAEIIPVVVKDSSTALLKNLNVAMLVGFQVCFVLVVLHVILVLQADTIYSGVVLLATSVVMAVALGMLFVLRKSMEAEAVMARAFEEFRESTINKTRGSTGVLLFFSALEKRMVILADKTVNDKVSADTWQKIVNSSLYLLKKDSPQALTEGIRYAIMESGRVCAEVCPKSPDDINEISNDVIFKD